MVKTSQTSWKICSARLQWLCSLPLSLLTSRQVAHQKQKHNLNCIELRHKIDFINWSIIDDTHIYLHGIPTLGVSGVWPISWSMNCPHNMCMLVSLWDRSLSLACSCMVVDTFLVLGRGWYLTPLVLIFVPFVPRNLNSPKHIVNATRVTLNMSDLKI